MDNNSFVHNFKKLQKKKKKPKGTSFFKHQEQLKELSDDEKEDNDDASSLKNLSDNFSEDEGLETESDIDDECTGEETDDKESIAYSSDNSELEDNSTFKRLNRRIEFKKCEKKKKYNILQEESDFDSE